MSKTETALRGSDSLRRLIPALLVLLVGALGGTTASHCQVFNSGSNGSDGALVLTTPGTILFDPTTFVPPLDPDGDNIYHFTTIQVGAGVTVRLSGRVLNGPVFWLASGNVQIDGIIDLDGEGGATGSPPVNNAAREPAQSGAGGFPGGVGQVAGAFPSSWQPGFGPGGATGLLGGTHGRGASYATGLAPYGNVFLVPLVGGSGGAGAADNGSAFPGGGGGAGGGALLLTSSSTITVNGQIRARGGSGGLAGAFCGGGGSGGAIRIVASVLAGTGSVAANGSGSPCGTGIGSDGRVRFEAFSHTFNGGVAPPAMRATPVQLFLPTSPPPAVRLVTAAGVPVPVRPNGTFTLPDVVFNSADPIVLELEGREVPPGTTVQVHLFSETGADQIITSTLLSGTLQLSTATATVTLPSGFSRGFLRAVWR